MFRNNIFLKYFFIPLLIGILVFFTLILITEKPTLFLFLQLDHTPVLNNIFNFITLWGDGWTAFIIVLWFLFFISYKKAIQLFVSYLGSSFIVQGLKHFVFDQYHRPVRWFEMQKLFHTIPDGLDPAFNYSFPSGHSTTAACIFFLLAMFISRPIFNFSFALMIFMVGYSRIYLYMHFPEDVLAGIVIGLTVASWVYFATEKYFSKRKSAIIEKSIWTSFFSGSKITG